MYNKDPPHGRCDPRGVQELFAQNWGIRSADVLSGALLTLARKKVQTCSGCHSFLTDENFRRKITSQISDPIALNPFWSHFEACGIRSGAPRLPTVLNKLRRSTYAPASGMYWACPIKVFLTDLFYKRRIVLVP
jgi:hypothetical protein